MIYEIKNRLDARQATYAKEAPITAIISITDLDMALNKFYPQTWLKEVLAIQFQDVEAPHPKCISVKQAKEIAAFVAALSATKCSVDSCSPYRQLMGFILIITYALIATVQWILSDPLVPYTTFQIAYALYVKTARLKPSRG